MQNKSTVKSIVKDYSAIIAGSLLIALGIHFFMVPSAIVMGSVTGLALVLTNFIPLPLSIITLILNLILLVIGFIFFGKEFGAKTVCSSILQPVFLNILEHMFPHVESMTHDMILDTVCVVMLITIGLVLLLNANASSGGLDVLAKVLNKYTHLEVGKGVALIGILTVLSSIFAYDTKTVIVGILGTYFNGLAIDAYIGGFSKKKRVCIISDQAPAINDYILHTLNRGVTQYTARGGYTEKPWNELVTILDNNEYAQLMEHVRANCPQAFVTVSTVNEVAGTWNTPDGYKTL